MTSQYSVVPSNDTPHETVGFEEKFSWKFFWRQVFVSSAIWTPFFMTGLILGTPTVLIPQMRREANSTDAVTVEMASWLSSSFAYAAVPCCFFMAFLSDYIGRKKTFIMVAFNQILMSSAFCLSTTPTHFIITEIFHGLTHASTMTVCIITIGEVISPKNRGFVLTIKSATVYWGIWAANAIGTFTHWKYISILCFLSAFYSLTVFLWPESPVWLANQGKYEESRKCHRWLRGCNEASEQELEMMIAQHIDRRKMPKEKSLKKFLGFFLEKEFYQPVLLSALMPVIYQLSGKQVVTMYAIDIIKKITSSESTAYRSMLILDAVSVFAMYAGCFLTKVCKRRFMLFFFGYAAVFFLLAMSLYLYLVHLTYLTENKYISISLLIGFSVSIGLGPIILTTSIFGELIPLRYKGQATVIIACVFVILQSVLLKNTPYIFKYLDMHGMFLFYGISVTVCLMILYKYLPETKDKTLQEIEKYFKD